MPRTKESPSLSNRTARLSLKARREPYWLVLEKGRALGYRKGKNGGTWIARYYDPIGTPPRVYEALGAADDTSDADGKMVLNFSQAQEAARNWFEIAYFRATGEKIHKGSYKVADAIDDYIADRKRNGVATAGRMHYDFNARVIPYLGTAPVKRLTKKKIEDWMDTIILLPARHRGKEGLPPQTEEELQSRKATANRIWKNLRAALNLAAREGKVGNSLGWKGVKEYKGTNTARVCFLSPAEQVRLVNACPSEDFRRLVKAGLFTGAREAELTELKKIDFRESENNIFIAKSKNGKQRYIDLTEEAVQFFTEITSGLSSEDKLFPRTTYDRAQKEPLGIWSRSELCRMMAEVCRTARVEPMVFHELRHTYASGLVNRGVPLVHVAEQLGHSDITMVQRHYGHLCPKAKADSIRSLAPVLGIHTPGSIAALEIQGA